IGYVTIGTKDMAKGKAFWIELLAPLGYKQVVDMRRMCLYGTGAGQPMLGVCLPYDEKDAQPGNGTMLAFVAGSREQVDELYKKALELGGSDEGAPGERGPTFYGAYFRDPDGNKAVFFKSGPA
ncbi:MAG: VOC family protein, partial [Pseudomonadales bacterium]|nr:VOC family protein [Pseudomonadales bacterium]